MQNGDIVDIITSKTGRPSLDWLNIVGSSESKSKIRNWFKRENKAENIEKGLEALEKEAKRLEGEIKRAQGMLSNEKFISKAPAAKVEAEKEKLEKYTSMAAQVAERLSQLKK